MDVFEAMATTRAMRRLDADRPVGDADVLTVVEAITTAATGRNRQPGRWGEAERRPVREVTHWGTWKSPPPG